MYTKKTIAFPEVTTIGELDVLASFLKSLKKEHYAKELNLPVGPDAKTIGQFIDDALKQIVVFKESYIPRSQIKVFSGFGVFNPIIWTPEECTNYKKSRLNEFLRLEQTYLITQKRVNELLLQLWDRKFDLMRECLESLAENDTSEVVLKKSKQLLESGGSVIGQIIVDLEKKNATYMFSYFPKIGLQFSVTHELSDWKDFYAGCKPKNLYRDLGYLQSCTNIDFLEEEIVRISNLLYPEAEIECYGLSEKKIKVMA